MGPFIVLIPEAVPERFVAKTPSFILLGLAKTGESARCAVPSANGVGSEVTCDTRTFLLHGLDHRAATEQQLIMIIKQV
jgi:hypothetical protein